MIIKTYINIFFFPFQHIENDTRSGFMQGLVASLSVIIVSELGDKTFFIAAIMAMRHPRMLVFIGAISALALMTVLSGRLPIPTGSMTKQNGTLMKSDVKGKKN